MSLYDELYKQLKGKGVAAEKLPTIDEQRTLLADIMKQFNALSRAQKIAAIKEAQQDLLGRNPKGYDSGVFIFQGFMDAVELSDGERDDFGKYSSATYFDKNRGSLGPNTRGLLTLDFANDAKYSAMVVEPVIEPKNPPTNGNTQKDYEQTETVETEADKAARLKREEDARKAKEEADRKAAEEAAKPKPLVASADDIARYTFKRSQIQYFENVSKHNPAAKGFTAAELKEVDEAVRAYAFKDGELRKENDQGMTRDYGSKTVADQLRAAVRSKLVKETSTPAEVAAIEAKIKTLSFDTGSTKTRSIVGTFTAAENAMINADNALSKQGDVIQAFFKQDENKKILDAAKIRTDGFAALAGVDESQRGVYFATAYIPALKTVAQEQEKVIRAEYQVKIDNENTKFKNAVDAENAKLRKYAYMEQIATIGYPLMIDEYKDVTKEKIKFENGVETKTPYTVKEKTGRQIPDPRSLQAFSAKLEDPAVRDALVATGLMDDKGNYVPLTYKDAKGVEKTITADVALKNPSKEYSDAMKPVLDAKFAFDEKEQKANAVKGANLDQGIVLNKIAVEKDKTSRDVQQAILKLTKEHDETLKKLVSERDVAIENSSANVLLRDSLDPKDGARIKAGEAATSALGKYEEAVKFYNMAASYQTTRLTKETSGGKATKGERGDLKELGDDIEKIRKTRVALAEAEVKKLEEAVKATADEAKKGALSTKLEAAKSNLKALNEIPKDFDQKDRVNMMLVTVGNTPLIAVDADSREEKKQKVAALKAAETEKKEAEKPAEKSKDQKAAEEKKTSKAVPAPAKTEQTTTKVEPIKQAAPIKPQIVELTGEVNALIAKIQSELGELKAPQEKGDWVSKDQAKASKKAWDKAVDALSDDLKSLKKLNEQDKATGTSFDAKLAETLDKARELGVVVTSEFKLEESQTIQNLKAKEAAKGK